MSIPTVTLHIEMYENDININFDYEEGNEPSAAAVLTGLMTGSFYVSVCELLSEKLETGEISEQSYNQIEKMVQMVLSSLVPEEDDSQPLMNPDEVFSRKYMPDNDLD